MAWGPLIALLLKALPDILFLWRHRIESGAREAIHEDVQEFREALCGGGDRQPISQLPEIGVSPRLDLDRAAELLERRVREARSVRAKLAQAGEA